MTAFQDLPSRRAARRNESADPSEFDVVGSSNPAASGEPAVGRRAARIAEGVPSSPPERGRRAADPSSSLNESGLSQPAPSDQPLLRPRRTNRQSESDSVPLPPMSPVGEPSFRYRSAPEPTPTAPELGHRSAAPSDFDYKTETRRAASPPRLRTTPMVSAVPETILDEQRPSSRVGVPQVPEQPVPLVSPDLTSSTGLADALSGSSWLASHGITESTGSAGSAPGSISPPLPPTVESTGSAPWTPSRGHWAAQLDLDEDDVPYEDSINRTVGGGVVTTSALVLPSIPDSDIRGPLTETGEILLTGSIDVSDSLSTAGVSARFEHEGIDQLFESHDAEAVPVDSAPVSASSAVSTHLGVNLGRASKGGKARPTTVLVIAAATGVAVVALLITAFAFNVFSW